MSARIRLRVATALFALLAALGLQFAIGAGPASAEGSQLTFVTASPVQTAFGGNWNVRLATRYAFQPTVAIPSDQASVDVYLSGIEGVFAAHLPIQADGSVYVSQTAASTLPPGEYQMSAILVPVPGSFIEGSQTTTPLVLSISSYALDAAITVDQASVADGEPVIEARLSGEFVDATEAVPAGTWAFTVTGGGKTVLETEVAQDAGDDEALRYAITEKLDRGVDYKVSATFTPVEALVAGLDVTQPTEVTFHTQDGGLGDAVPYPLWLLILTAVVPLGLAIAAIVLTVKASGRNAALAGGVGTGPQPAPTAPTEEFLSVEDLFPLQDAAEPYAPQATPQADIATPTQVLPPAQPYPPGQDWSLQGPPEETPTERIDPSDPEHLR